jgi:cytidyltransferase-like protein
MNKEIKYGLFLGRFQPIHNGHASIIEQIKLDGLEPIILIGSAQEFGTYKNKYHVLDRKEMIWLIYPKIKIICLHDNSSWEEWFSDMDKSLKLGLDENWKEKSILYTHNKEEDRQDFEYKGIKFKNDFYSQCFVYEGLKTKNLKTHFSDIYIRATQVRNNLEEHKHHLHPKVYEFIKTKEIENRNK